MTDNKSSSWPGRALALAGAVIVLLLSLSALHAGDAVGQHPRPSPGTLKVGQVAPDFDLVRLEAVKTEGNAAGKTRAYPKADQVMLSSFRGKKPTVLIFSSYT